MLNRILISVSIVLTSSVQEYSKYVTTLSPWKYMGAEQDIQYTLYIAVLGQFVCVTWLKSVIVTLERQCDTLQPCNTKSSFYRNKSLINNHIILFWFKFWSNNSYTVAYVNLPSSSLSFESSLISHISLQTFSTGIVRLEIIYFWSLCHHSC